MTKLMVTGGLSGFHAFAGDNILLFIEDKGKSCVQNPAGSLNILTFQLILITLHRTYFDGVGFHGCT